MKLEEEKGCYLEGHKRFKVLTEQIVNFSNLNEKETY